MSGYDVVVPDRLGKQLAQMTNLDDLRGFLDDVDVAESAVNLLRMTDLHSAAMRRLTRLGFGPDDYDAAKRAMLCLLFSREVETQLKAEFDRSVDAYLAA